MGLSERCLWYRGIPSIPTGYNNNYHFLQTPEARRPSCRSTSTIGASSILDGPARTCRTGISQFAGSSRGHWEGDTLVVETTNLREPFIRRWSPSRSTRCRGVKLSEHGDASSSASRGPVPTRSTTQFTIHDPGDLDAVVVGRTAACTRLDLPDVRVRVPRGHYGMFNMLTGSRAEEAAASEGP